MEGSGLQEGGPCIPHGPGGAPQCMAAHTPRLWAAAEPQQCLVPQGHGGGDTWGPWVLPLSQ